MRAIGLDVHLDFCEVAISEDGAVRSAGRIEATPEQIELFARSLGAEDRVSGHGRRYGLLVPPARDHKPSVPARHAPISRRLTDSVSIPLRAITQAITEFEFHISPVPSSTRPQTGVGT
jgi:hypothetical protein